ncbi:SymE family type I addiction module toxin [Xanthomonas codiaei]|uniref:SymE family type I addiction module toxin n=1 Tax=Xanthomonas codiaei TaxID=56463 RepID=A0ABW9MS97_9XANT
MSKSGSLIGRSADAGDQYQPHLRLSGLWLEHLGVAIDTKLRITASAGQFLMGVSADEGAYR